MTPLIIAGILIAIILSAVLLMYNGFVSAQNIVEEAGSYFSTMERILLMKTSSALFRCDVAEAMR